MNSKEPLHPDFKINFMPQINGHELRKLKTTPASKYEDCIYGLTKSFVLVRHFAFLPLKCIWAGKVALQLIWRIPSNQF